METARRDAVVPHGASYGGYLTLFALGKRPELWAAGVALIAIGDWTLLYEDGEALREYDVPSSKGRLTSAQASMPRRRRSPTSLISGHPS